MKPVYSVIVPVFNETGCLEELHRRVSEVMEKTGESWELVLVDDGSTDGSTEMIHNFAQTDSHVRPVIFARNYGHQLAVTAGMDYSRGQAVIVIDADLQDPPEVMLDLIAKWREGYEVVYAVREEREGESGFKLFTASLFYKVIHKITDIKIPMNTGDFRLLDRKVVNVMNTMREHQRFLRGMSIWTGFRQIGVPYKRAARFAGSTKYPLKKMIKLAMTAITSFSYFPLQLATWVGAFFTAVSFLFLVVMIILRFAAHSTFLAGQVTTLVAVIFLGGIQLIFLGVLGEYIGRIYDEVKGRPLYTTRETPSDENN
ncbi:MAG: glycosyltransferase family 2 protein [Anaerolineaceae bacterium]|nr:glycosyltransferase family 2 protein [Anaerolineaceae bacterium]